MIYSSSALSPPAIVHAGGSNDQMDTKVHQWITPWKAKEDVFDVGIIGAPLSRSSISVSGASETPNAMRLAWKGFSTWYADFDVELTPLQVRDIGDIRMHTTDIQQCHDNIEKGLISLYQHYLDRPFLPIVIGGDHSITRPAFNAFAKANKDASIGIIQFDTHFDVRNLVDGGPSNGTPFRGLIEQDHTVKGENIIQIGIHGFSNSAVYRDYVKAQGITYFTMRDIRKQGAEYIIQHSVESLAKKVDIIYVTVDMDVLDISHCPGSPGAAPGSMLSWELFECLYFLGQQSIVKAVDIVELDPTRDIANMSVKTACHTMLSFLSGLVQRNKH
ncbi:agmatinase family protein [Longirhabdus pacifica]|uniref:agmatinase family protein n=1 Tax=Longirhabdus pacifica TaxID=2305227 RepID=UPI001F0BF044|nr:agmatinase family protein [Longirhabdus pacifica]